jgi:predicted membrane-bound spermidine synthase
LWFQLWDSLERIHGDSPAGNYARLLFGDLRFAVSSLTHEELLNGPRGALDGMPAALDKLRMIRLALWWVTPVLTGAVIMAQELVAFRLYAPYFGYSIYVWGSMISVVLAALALGYAVGGWSADRSETSLPLYITILGSAVYQLAILFAVHGMLPVFARWGDFIGTILASLVIFAPPMTAMATAGPFVIRLLAESGRVGSVAGKVYALATIGSIGGVLATSFWLVPQFGTQKTMAVICALSGVVAVAGLALRVPAALLLLGLIVGALEFVPRTTWSQNTVWVQESPYNLVRVVRDNQRLILKLNDEGGIHTIRDQRTGWTGHYYDDFALGPLLTPAQHLLVLGMAGGGSIASTLITSPEVDIDAVEIDPKVVEAATRFFGLNPQNGRLHIHIADARPWLAQNEGKYDIVHVDLYQGGPYIPFYLITVEFFGAVRAHMSADGLVMMNLFDISKDHELLLSTAATLKRVFPTVTVLSLGGGNRVLLAFSKATPNSLICARLASYEGNGGVKRLGAAAAARISEVEIPAGVREFTDDFAPVEPMTRRMLRSGGHR